MPEPRFWKALVVTGLLVVPLSLLVRAIVPMNDLGWFLVAALSTLTIASLVHGRVRNDWRARDTMAQETFYRRTSVAPRVRIGKR